MPRKTKAVRRLADPPESYIRPEFLDAGDRPMKTSFRYWAEHALHWYALLFAVSFALWIGSNAAGALAGK